MAETMTLASPVQTDGGQITSLLIREPTCAEMARAWKHVEATNNPEANFLFERELVAGVGGFARPTLLDNLSMADLAAASARISKLIDLGLEGFDPESLDAEIVLAEPLVESGVEYSTLSLRPARTGEMLKARGHLRTSQGPASNLAYQMALAAAVADVPMKVVHRMPVTSVMRAAMTIEVFSVRPPGTGSA